MITKTTMRVIAHNKRAFHDYEITDKIEAGLVLTGDEVKSLRAGHVSLVGCFAAIKQGELFLVNAHISPYEKAYQRNEDKARASRKLLLHKRELTRLMGLIARKGITIVPLRLYFNNRSKVKVELGIAKHRKAAGKKQLLKERDIKRETQRELKDRLGR